MQSRLHTARQRSKRLRAQLICLLAISLILTLAACRPKRTQSHDAALDAARIAGKRISPAEDIPRSQPDPTREKIQEQLVNAMDQFGLNLLPSLYQNLGPDENLLIAPASCYSILAWAYEGADDDYEKQYLKDLHMPNENTLRSAMDLFTPRNFTNETSSYENLNSIWLAKNSSPLEDDFAKITGRLYKGEVYSVDFRNDQASRLLNHYINEVTRGQINSMPAPPQDTRLVLLNSFYYKSPWSHRFDKGQTSDDVFTSGSRRSTQAFMHNKLDSAQALQNQAFDALDMPLDYGTLRLILPKKESDFDRILRDADLLNAALCRPAEQRYNVTLSLPRLNIKGVNDLIRSLTACGMTQYFDPANPIYDELLDDESLYIAQLLQGRALAVNEDGVEASAYTAAVDKETAMQPANQKLQLDFNRPFFFILRDDDGYPLLIGAIRNPQDSGSQG